MQNFISLRTHLFENVSAHIALVGMPDWAKYKHHGYPDPLMRESARSGRHHITIIEVDNLEDGFYRFIEAANYCNGATNKGYIKIIGGEIVEKSEVLESIILSDQDKSMLEAQKLRGQEILKDWEEKERAEGIKREWEEAEKAIKKNNKKIKKIQEAGSTALDVEAFRKLTAEQLIEMIIDQQKIIEGLKPKP